MKYFFLWINLLFILSACNNPPADELYILLKQADSIAETSPDNAYAILSSIEQPEEMNNRNFAYWCMISGNIFNRRTDSNKTFLPASYFKRANHYYKQHGNTEQQAFIHLYLGRSYQEQEIYDQAMKIYAEALKDAENWKEYNAAGMICSYMGDIYQIQSLSDKCKEKYKEAIHYFDLAQKPRTKVTILVDLGFEFLNTEEPEKGLIYMQQADSIAQLINDSIVIRYIYYYTGLAYNELENYAIAEEYLLKALQFSQQKTDSIINYYALNSVYIYSGNFQKAREALKLGTNEHTNAGVLFQQFWIEKGRAKL